MCSKYGQWRSNVFIRDNYFCILCNKKGGELQADHIKQFISILRENKVVTLEQALKCEELWDIANGRTLCKKCHRNTDTFGNYNKKTHVEDNDNTPVEGEIKAVGDGTVTLGDRS